MDDQGTNRASGGSTMSRVLISILLAVCLLGDFCVLAWWLDYNSTKTVRRWQLSLRGILIITAIAALQLWAMVIYIRPK
jgi:hypothetical protein